MAFSFIINKNNSYSINIDWGEYKEINVEGRKKYKRKPLNKVFNILRNDFPEIGKSKEYLIDKSCLKVILTNRTAKTDFFDYKNSDLFTLSVINTNQWDDKKRPPFDLCVYQIQMSISTNDKNAFQPYPEPVNFDSYDYKLNTLLYREVKTFGVGHSCSVEWNIKPNSSIIQSTFTPSHEMQEIEFNAIQGQNYKMLDLSPVNWDNKKSTDILKSITKSYANWIDEQIRILKNLSIDKKLINQAQDNISQCKHSLNRIKNRINIIQNNKNTLLAFQYMNHDA